MNGGLGRTVSVLSASTVLISNCALGFEAAGTELASAIKSALQRRPGPYTDPVRPVYKGRNPNRLPQTRGNMWWPKALEDAKASRMKRSGIAELEEFGPKALECAAEPRFGSPLLLAVERAPAPEMDFPAQPRNAAAVPSSWLELWASLEPAPQGPPGHGLGVDPHSGASLPWEGGFPSFNGGSVNTGNGNKLTAIHLTGWKDRGGMEVDFTLYHNSETTYNDELGKGWTWTYDLYINEGDWWPGQVRRNSGATARCPCCPCGLLGWLGPLQASE